MSTEIDKRIVEMKFDNKDFEKNVQQSLSTIDKLKIALDFDGGKGFETLTKAASKVDMSNISRQADQVQAKFSAIQIAGYTMVSELTRSFINFGKNIWGSTFGQIKSGGMARALKIEQAEFKMRALTRNMFDASIEGDALEAKVSGLMSKMSDAIDNAVTGTAYGYDAAADVASQLMASGIRDAQKMENYLKGVAGAAAMTGNSFEQLGHVFTTVASNGKLMTMQLRQFSTYGLNLSATLADQLGKSEAQINKMVTDGEITFEQFADALALAYGGAAQEADNTFSGVTSNIKAQLSRLGQRFAKPFIENAIPALKQVKSAIKQVSASLAPMAERFDNASKYLFTYLEGVLESINFKKVEMMFRGLENIAYSLVLVLHSLHNAFQRVFPKSFLTTLYEGSRVFLEFTEQILPTKRALEGLENVFTVLLTPLKMIFIIIKNITRIATPILKVLFNIANAIFELFYFTKPLINLVLNAINEMDIFNKTLLIFSNIAAVVIELLRAGVTILALLFYQISKSKSLNDLINVFKVFGTVIMTVAKYALYALGGAFMLVYSVFEKIGNYLPGILEKITALCTKIHNKVVPFIKDIYNAIKTRDFSFILNRIKKELEDLQWEWNRFYRRKLKSHVENLSASFEKFKGVFVSFATTVKNNIKSLTAAKIIFGAFGVSAIIFVVSLIRLNDAFGRLILTVRQIPFVFTRINQTLKSFNKYIAPAALVMSFAIAIGVLALSLKQISEIPGDDLARSAKVLGAFVGGLMIFAYVMNKASSITHDANTVVTMLNPAGTTILAMAASIYILARAFKLLGDSVEQISNVNLILGYVLGSMFILAGIVTLMAKVAPKMELSSFVFIAFAHSVYTLSKALVMISKVEVTPDSLKNLLSSMIGFGIAIAITGKATVGSALSILSFTVGLLIIYEVLKKLSKMTAEDIEQGIVNVSKIFTFLIVVSEVSKKLSLKNGIDIGTGSLDLLIGMSALIIACAAFMKIIGTMSNEQISQASGALIGISFMLTICVGLIMMFNYWSQVGYRESVMAKTNMTMMYESVAKIGSIMISLGAALILVAAATKVFATLDRDTWWAPLVAIGMLVALSTMLDLVLDSCRSLVGVDVKPILGLIATVVSVMGSMALLTFAAKDDPKAVLVAAGAVFIALAGLALLMAAMKGFAKQSRQLNTNVASATDEVLAIMALLGIIAFMMVYVTDKIYYEQDIYAFDVTMGVLMLGMIGMALAVAIVMKILNSIRVDQIISLAEDKMWKLGLMFTAIMLSLMSVAASMYIISKIPTDKLKSVGITVSIISGAILALLVAVPFILKLWNSLGATPKAFLEVGAGIAILASSILVIASSLALMSNLTDPERLLTDAAVIAALLGEVFVIALVLTALDRKYEGASASNAALGFLGIASSILVIAAAFVALEKAHINPGGVINYAIAITILLGALTLLTVVLTAVANACVLAQPALFGMAALFGSLGIVGIGASLALKSLVESFKVFSNASTEEINKFVDSLLAFTARVPEIITALALSIVESAPAVGFAIAAIASAGILALAGALSEMITVVLDSLTLILKAFSEWGTDPGTVTVIHDTAHALGLLFMDGIVAGVFDGINDSKLLQEASAKFFGFFDPTKQETDWKYTNFVEAQADQLKSAMYKVYSGKNTWEEYGSYIIGGLNLGIQKGYWTYAQACAQLADYGLEAYQDELQIHSPSLRMMRMGEYTVMGVIEGIRNGEYTLQEAMEACAEGAVNKFSSIFTDSNLLKNSSLFNANGVKSRQELELQGRQLVWDDSINDYVENWEASGYSSLDEFVDAQTSKGYNLLEELLGGFNFDDIIPDYDLSGMKDGLNDLGEESDKAKERLDKLRDSLLSTMDIFTEFDDSIDMSGRQVLKTFMGQIEGVGKWSDMLITLAKRGLNVDILHQLEEEGPKSYKKVNAILKMSNNEIAMLNAMHEDSVALADASIKSIEAAANNVKALTLKDIGEDLGESLAEGVTDGIEESTPSILDSMKNLGDSSIEALRASLEFEKALEPINEFRKGVYQQVQSSLNLFDEVKQKTDKEKMEEQISTTQMLYNMAENTKKIGRWANNLKKLAARGMSEGLLESLRELGPEGADKVDAFVRMTDAELKKANNLYASSADISGYVADKLTSTYAEQGFAMALGLKEGVNEGKDDLLAEMYKIGTESSEGFKNGIDPYAAEEAMILLGNNSLSAICELLAINSPSREMYQIGVWTVEGFVLGIGAGTKSVSKKMSELANNVIVSCNNFMPLTKFKSIGENIVNGIAMGISNSVNLVGTSISTVANEIMKGLMRPLGINSPSKFAAYCAEMLNLGFANEMDNNDLMINSTEDKANEIKNAMAEQLLNIGDALSMEDVYEPVIRPVWDMTDVQNGYNSITDILERTPMNINGTINSANSANKSGPSQDAIMITNAINNLAADQKAIRSEINSLRTDTVNLGNRIDGMYVRLDGNALVGQIVNPMDTAMGAKSIKNARRRV